jgi:glycosyltransferase involved in cell wall biosynthesis
MKILYLSNYPFGICFGGKEMQLQSYLTYINKISQSKLFVKLLDWWDKAELYNADILHLWGHGTYRHLIRQIKIHRKGIKIVLSPTIYYKGWKYSKIAFYIGDNLPFPNFYKNVKYEIENSDIIIVNSESEKRMIEKKISKTSKIKVLHNAVDDDFNIIEDSLKDIFLKKIGLKKFEYVLSVGMPDERKNSINMVKAFINVHKYINKKLVIIGSPRFIFEKNKKIFNELLKKHSEIIIHIPFLDKEKESHLLKSAYFNCAFHYLPSYIETPGIANLEALYFGKNIVVGDCPPVREYFGSKAIYCDPANIKSIEKALLEGNGLPYYNLENIELVRKKYLYSIIVQQLVEIYKSLLINE